jgi:hypothetical protein
MGALDATGDPLADTLRDLMDPLWLALTDDEHRFLDSRALEAPATGAILVPVRNSLFRPRPVAHAPANVVRDRPIGRSFDLRGLAA